MDDSALLRQYVENNSDEAFSGLVARHVNLVYSVALRQVNDPHHAEEITQAVFLILAKKASHLRHDKALSSWLFQTTRLTANNFIRSESRRRQREQEAYMQSTLNEAGAEVWPQISPLLDSAVAGLREKDRQAIVLRFYEGKNLRDIGSVLGASEDAAEKRLTRAVEKLRNYFFKRGVVLSGAVIAGAISANSVQAAPTVLAKTASVAAATKGTLASATVMSLAKATLFSMKLKTTVLCGVIFGAGVGVFLAWQSTAVPVRAASTAITLPIKLANADFQGVSNEEFIFGVDENTRRTSNSPPAGHIKSLFTPQLSGSADYLASIAANHPLAGSRRIQYNIEKGSPLLGRHIRINGWMKGSEVRNWAGATLLVADKDGHIFADDDMPDRPLRGTTDWQPVEFVTDIPSEPCSIRFMPTLYGTGEIWCDDFQIDFAPADLASTDDRKWHFWSETPSDYAASTDYNVTHNDHPALCITYTPNGEAPKNSWMWWGQDIRAPEKYCGHTVRMSGWIKTENVSGRIHPNLRPKGPGFKLLARDSLVSDFRLKGTLDWTKYSLTCVIPKETQCLDTGFAFSGSGKVWLDMESVKYEIIK